MKPMEGGGREEEVRVLLGQLHGRVSDLLESTRKSPFRQGVLRAPRSASRVLDFVPAMVGGVATVQWHEGPCQ